VLPIAADVRVILAAGHDRLSVQGLLARCIDESPRVSTMV
jgi:hypothetical protein